jgi:hypothetical protein
MISVMVLILCIATMYLAGRLARRRGAAQRP